MSIPPLYNSFDENEATKCVFCYSSVDDIVLYGDKYTKKGITFHNFCLVSHHSIVSNIRFFTFHLKYLICCLCLLIYFQLFSSGLQQKNESEEDILGYLEDDVRREVKRASKLVSCYS